RLREAAKLGFRTAVVPRRIHRSAGEPWPEGIRIIEARSLREALGHALIQESAGTGEMPAQKSTRPGSSSARRPTPETAEPESD
ncbi:MAG TPA: hypothetical protein VF806_09940, partial [Anaerolineaceae bacterium]